MSINLKKNHVEKAAHYLRKCLKLSLIFSSFSLVVSIILILIDRQEKWNLNEFSIGFFWISLIISIYSIVFSMLSILILMISYRVKKQIMWPFLKTEIILLILTITLILICIDKTNLY